MKLPTIIFLRSVFALSALSFTVLSSQAAAYNLPDTGQTKCYDPTVATVNEISCTGTGQDGAYILNPMSFTDNSDGTITDNNTGLVWQKCSNGQNNDPTCSGPAVQQPRLDAGSTCSSLSLAANSWRLPTKKELTGIIDYSISAPGPVIQTVYFPNTVAAEYWTSTTFAFAPSTKAWVVDFATGAVSGLSQGNTYYVRCVSGTSLLPQ